MAPRDEPLNILMIDDDTFFSLAVEKMLHATGRRLKFAREATARAGKERLGKETFDCVLLDYQLPDNDGVTFLRENPTLVKYTPIILMTGVDDDTLGFKAVSIGAQDYVVKHTVTGGSLFRSIDYAVERHRVLMEHDQLKRIVDRSPACAFMLSIKGRFPVQYVSDNVKEILGWSPKDFQGGAIDYLDIVHAEDVAAFQRQVETRSMAPENGFNHEYRLVAKNGSSVWVADHAWISRDLRNRETVYQGIVIDISARRKMETRIFQTNQKLDLILNTMEELVAYFDRDMRVTWTNRAFQKSINAKEKDILGKNCRELWGVGDDCSTCPGKDCRSARNVSSFTLKIPGGRVFSVNHYPVIDNNGQVVGFIQVALNVTERLKAEEEAKMTRERLVQADKLASLGTLVAGIAHEINNPIGFVSSNIGTLKTYISAFKEAMDGNATVRAAVNGGDLTEAKEAAGRVAALLKTRKIDFMLQDVPNLLEESLDGAERVRKIIQNLNHFARVDEADIKETDINEGIEMTLRVVWNALKYKCDVIKNLQPLPPLRCYPQQLNQVFLNLFINAAQAIKASGELRISTAIEGEWIVVSIADTGEGIAPENITRVFDPFFTTKDVGKGTGLGLSISHGIVQKHGGRIDVKSELGKGTEFKIFLPISGVPENERK